MREPIALANTKYFKLGALALAATLMLSACSARETNEQSAAGQTPQDSVSTPTTRVELTDQRGKNLSLDAPATKVAITVMPAPAIMAAVDQSWDKIVGINESTLKANKQGIITRIFPQAGDTPVVANASFDPNVETILNLDPDVVIQWGNKGDSITAPIEQAGFPVIGLKYGTQEDLETWITLFAKVIGKEQRGKDMLARMDKEAAEITAQVSKFSGPKPRGLQLSYAADALTVSNDKTYTKHIFDLAGIQNVAGESLTQDGVVSPEQIIAWDPEFIILSAFDSATPADVYADARLKDVSAIKNKRVYRAPLGVYRMQVPSAESPIMWHWTAALAHPGKYQVDFPAKMRDLEKFLYNYDVTEEDIALTLRTDINKDSANYELVTK